MIGIVGIVFEQMGVLFVGVVVVVCEVVEIGSMVFDQIGDVYCDDLYMILVGFWVVYFFGCFEQFLGEVQCCFWVYVVDYFDWDEVDVGWQWYLGCVDIFCVQVFGR